MHARRTVQGIHTKTRIIGKYRHLHNIVDRLRLDERVLGKGLAVLVGIDVRACLLLGEDFDAKRR